MEVDWGDLIQPGAREQFLGSTAPPLISKDFYQRLIAGTFQTLDEELDFLANTIHDTGKVIAKDDTPLPSEMLTFSMTGKEFPRPHPMIKERLPRTISKAELLKKIASAPHRIPGEQRDAENEDEVPPFAHIPDWKPTDLIENITKDDIKMGHGLTSAQQEGLIELIMSYVEVFGKVGRIGLVKGYKATVNTGDNPLPHAQHLRPAGPEK